MTPVESFRVALEGFGRQVDRIGDDQWAQRTPCTEWDVRALVNHIVSELAWVPETFGGKTMEEVGDRFEGDLLGDDPKGAFRAFAGPALAAVEEPGAGERIVHLSFGDHPAAEYRSQLTCDLLIHTWDLARGIGADVILDPTVVEDVTTFLSSEIEMWRAGGHLAAAVDLAEDASAQDRLLAMAGRRP